MACANNRARDSFADVSEVPRAIQNDEGNSLLLEATRAAQRAISERKTATIQAATIQAGATRDFVERSTTGTAQALRVREQEMNLNATANAVGIQAQQTRQAATETSAARRSEATATAIIQAQHLAATQTADAMHATQTTFAATSTRGAQEIQAALEREQATATAQAVQLSIVQAQENAARSQTWNDFFDSLMKIVLAIGTLAALIMLIIQVARYLDVLAMRQRLVETRSGTVMIVAMNGQPHAQMVSPNYGLQPTPNLLDAGTDEFDVSQLRATTQQADELFKLTNARGETFITKTDPEAEAREMQRQLAMRLLRASIRHYAARGFDAREVNRIPSFRELNWSSETWVRAVQSLKPHVLAKQGRGGGTYCAVEYPTLMSLYIAVGERRIVLGQPVQPSPTLADVAT